MLQHPDPRQTRSLSEPSFRLDLASFSPGSVPSTAGAILYCSFLSKNQSINRFAA